MFKKIKLSAPKTLDDMPLAMFSRIKAIIQDDSKEEKAKIIEIVALATKSHYKDIANANGQKVIEIYTHVINLIANYKPKECPKEITLNGKTYVLRGSSKKWNAAQLVDARIMQDKWLTHHHWIAAIMYVEKGLVYGQEDEHGNTINPMTERAEHIKLYLSTQVYLDLESFFLPLYNKQVRGLKGVPKKDRINVQHLVENTRREIKMISQLLTQEQKQEHGKILSTL